MAKKKRATADPGESAATTSETPKNSTEPQPQAEPTQPTEQSPEPFDPQAFIHEFCKLLPNAEADKLNTITNQPREAVHEPALRMNDYAWALFGELVLRRVLAMPNFDHTDDKDIIQAAQDVHDVVMSLSNALAAVFPEGDCLP